MRVRTAVIIHVKLSTALLEVIGFEISSNLLSNWPTSEVLGRQSHWLAEGYVALSQIGQRALHNELVLFVVTQEVHPQRRLGTKLLAKNLRVPADNEAILCTSKRNIQASRIIEETDALVLV